MAECMPTGNVVRDQCADDGDDGDKNERKIVTLRA